MTGMHFLTLTSTFLIIYLTKPHLVSMPLSASSAARGAVSAAVKQPLEEALHMRNRFRYPGTDICIGLWIVLLYLMTM